MCVHDVFLRMYEQRGDPGIPDSQVREKVFELFQTRNKKVFGELLARAKLMNKLIEKVQSGEQLSKDEIALAGTIKSV